MENVLEDYLHGHLLGINYENGREVYNNKVYKDKFCATLEKFHIVPSFWSAPFPSLFRAALAHAMDSIKHKGQ